jgi:hypothetical protein
MKTVNGLAYLRGLVRDWERGILDPDDLARRLRAFVNEETEIAKAEAEEEKAR